MSIIEILKEQIVTILVVLTIIPIVLTSIFSHREKDERGEQIISKGYQYTYVFLVVSLLVLISVNKFNDITFEQFRGGLIICVLLSMSFLSISIFFLNRKN